MADDSLHPSDRPRHAHRPARTDGRRRGRLIAVSVLIISAIAAVLVGLSWDRSGDAVADQPVAPTTVTVTSAPATTPTPTATEPAPTSDVPSTFVDAMHQIGIPLDAHTGWVVAQGICVRLGQPDKYDQFKLSEGVERLFPSVPDEDAHEFVAMVAEKVCPR
jgi:hypothetical protein